MGVAAARLGAAILKESRLPCKDGACAREHAASLLLAGWTARDGLGDGDGRSGARSDVYTDVYLALSRRFSAMREHAKTMLNLGCGDDVREGYVNLDVIPGRGVDVLHDIHETPWPFGDAAFSRVLARHVLEHVLPMHDGRGFLRVMDEIHRVLEPGGVLVVEGPHWANDAMTWGDPYAYAERAAADVPALRRGAPLVRLARSFRLEGRANYRVGTSFCGRAVALEGVPATDGGALYAHARERAQRRRIHGGRPRERAPRVVIRTRIAGCASPSSGSYRLALLSRS